VISYAELRGRAAAFVAEWVERGEQVLIICPVREAADEIATAACPRALIGVHRFSFRDFVHTVGAQELNERRLVPMTHIVVREALAARVTAESLAQNELGYLRAVARFPGFPRALSDTLEELRLNGKGPAAVRLCGQSGPDLAQLLDGYEKEIGERNLADYPIRVELAQRAVESGAHQFRSMPVVLIDVNPRSLAERDLVESLKRWSIGSLDLQPTPAAEARVESSLQALQQNIRLQDSGPLRALDESFEIFSASGEALECVEIARRAGDRAEAGVRFDQMAILLRSPERYEPLVIEALRRAGIPAYCTGGTRRPDPAGRSFLALLRCADEGLSASRFAEYMSLGQMPQDDEPKTPAAWERLLVDAAVIGGSGRWESRLDGLKKDLYRQYEDSDDEQTKEHLERRIAAIESLSGFALPLIQKLADLPVSATWGDWIPVLADLAEMTLRDPERIHALLDELQPMSEIGPITLNGVLQVLGDHLRLLRYHSPETHYGKVFVGGIEDARGLSFNTVFVPGVNESQFPRPPAEDPLLLEAQRKLLSIELRTDDLELLFIATSCASGRLVMSWSRLDLLTGRSRVPSFYAFNAHRSAGGPEMDVRAFEDLAASAAESRIEWPAPRVARNAIDDGEFDLATLAPRDKGSGQYLKRLPGRAVESLRARWYRWHKPWKAADGLILEQIGNDPLLQYRQISRTMSPSALEQFARCPYRFALRTIHGLRPAERPAGIQRVSPAIRGIIYHRAQFELLRDLKSRDLLPVDSGNLKLVLERLDAVIVEVALRAKADVAPAIPQIWDAEMASIRADLRGWMQHRATIEPDWNPEFFELSFGLKDLANHDPRSSSNPVVVAGGYLLSGSIDLVERHKTGLLRVVDHKTGKVPTPKPEMVGGGEALQPALYAMAAETMLQSQIVGGRLFYSTIAQNYTVVDIPLHEWTRRRASQVLRTVDEALQKGFLPAAPRKDGCTGCEYLPVCGPYEEDRVKIKAQPELNPLKELRLMK